MYGFIRKANEKPYIYPSAIPMATKLGKVVTCDGETPSSKSLTFRSRGHVTNSKTYICTLTIPMAIKLGKEGTLLLEDPIYLVR